MAIPAENPHMQQHAHHERTDESLVAEVARRSRLAAEVVVLSTKAVELTTQTVEALAKTADAVATKIEEMLVDAARDHRSAEATR